MLHPHTDVQTIIAISANSGSYCLMAYIVCDSGKVEKLPCLERPSFLFVQSSSQ